MSYEQVDVFVTGVIYLAAVFVLFLIGKFVYDRLHPSFDLKSELFERDNFALSLAVVGYYLGLVLALGGVLAGEGVDLANDLFDIFFFGLAAIVLINLSGWINDKVILSKFDNRKEIIGDRNAGTGAIEGGNHVANGLIVAGALDGDNVDLVIVVAFWAVGQLALILAGLLYDRLTSFDLHDEIERDNVAVGVAFAGLLIALGNLVGLSVSGDFISWTTDLTDVAVFLGMALILLPLVRIVTDKLLAPGVRLSAELIQEHPNVGAGVLEAFSYVAASMLIGWAIA
ncbi:MAG: DUF350 domain-containing protein [Acidobacteriota bacterium]